MAIFKWYRGEVYQFWVVLRDKAGSVISEAFSDLELVVRLPATTIRISGAAGTAVDGDALVPAALFLFDDAALGMAPSGTHCAELWG